MKKLSFVSNGFSALLVAQFLSAFADNAIFVAAIALIKHSTHVGFYEAALQSAFLVAYIVLAPYVGHYADGHAKARVMLMSNNIKLLGALAMVVGLDPLVAYSIIGIGAASYSPAKYGILLQILPEEKLISANSMIESSSIVAIIVGTVFGGYLADHSLHILFWSCALFYFVAALVNLLIPKTPIVKPFSWYSLGFYSINFFAMFQQFFKNKQARYCILGTTTFWSTGIVLRLLLFVWVPFVFLNADNSLPATLMGVVSVGICLGAIVAGLWINFSRIRIAFLSGIVLAPLILLIIVTRHLPLLFALMVAIGFFGGIFMVPLNAVIQKAGEKTIGTGSALAVQNFCENGGMLVFSMIYGLLQGIHLPLSMICAILGLTVLFMMAFLIKRTSGLIMDT